MTNEFPDELLSAFLDDELSATERAQVEQHLAASESDRQLLAELKSLRAEVAALPPMAVKADFADRVVRSALAEAERQAAERQAAQKPSGAAVTVSKARRSWRRWMVGGAIAGSTALALFFLLLVQPWRQPPQSTPIAKTPVPVIEPALELKDQFVKSIGEVWPAEGEAIVLRLRVGKGTPLDSALDEALNKAGLAPLAANVSTSAAQWQQAYLRALDAKLGASATNSNDNFLSSTVAAAEALFVEAPIERLEGVISELSAATKQPIHLSAAGKLALAGRASSRESGAEGEAGSSQAFAQRLNASVFRLEKNLATSAKAIATRPAGPRPQPQQTVRVLILVEVQ